MACRTEPSKRVIVESTWLLAAAITAVSAGTSGRTPTAADAVERLIFKAMSKKKSPNCGREKMT
jgi:hypothetical protein